MSGKGPDRYGVLLFSVTQLLLFVWRNTESGGILTDGCDFPGEEVGEVGDF